MPTIAYFYSLLSPWTYLASDRLETIAARHDASIDYHPVDFMHVLPQTGGQPVPQRHPFRQEYRLQELRRAAEMTGMDINLQPAHWPVDAAPASQAVIAAGSSGADMGALTRAFLSAVWAEDRDISDSATIATILADNGVEASDLADAETEAAAEFARNTELALESGVFGAPFYVVDGTERFWGQDRLDHLDWHLAGRGRR